MSREYLQFPGGRPLRRRRERVLISATGGWRGTAALLWGLSSVEMWLEQLGHKFLCDRGRDSFRNLKLRLHFGRSALECGRGLFENISFKRSGQSWKFCRAAFCRISLGFSAISIRPRRLFFKRTPAAVRKLLGGLNNEMSSLQACRECNSSDSSTSYPHPG